MRQDSGSSAPNKLPNYFTTPGSTRIPLAYPTSCHKDIDNIIGQISSRIISASLEVSCSDFPVWLKLFATALGIGLRIYRFIKDSHFGKSICVLNLACASNGSQALVLLRAFERNRALAAAEGVSPLILDIGAEENGSMELERRFGCSVHGCGVV